MTINNRGLAGQPILPYTDNRGYAGSDMFFDLTFLDHTNTPVTPTSLKYRIDDLTNALPMVALTTVSPGLLTGSTFTLQVPGATWAMSYQYQGSQVCQISWTYTAIDTVTGASYTETAVTIVELIAVQTPT